MVRTILRHPDIHPVNFDGIVTVAPQMLDFLELVKRVARTDTTVLVRGETGTGKELVAAVLHNRSPRRKAPFQAINCATLTPELLASELFGHVKGAYTGAIRDRPGLLKSSDGGSLFLDEVAEMPLDLQARLLRVLQERTFVPLGGTEPVQVDVRILSATHRALREEVAKGRFREDLMYRIRIVPLFLPPLRARTGDVEALTWHFVREFNQKGFRVVEGIDKRTMDALLAYRWPGNVRELRNVLEYAFTVGEGPILRLEDLTPELRGEPPPERLEDPRTEEDLERRRLLDALDRCGGKKGEAAALLGMSRSTLWRKLKEYRIS